MTVRAAPVAKLKMLLAEAGDVFRLQRVGPVGERLLHLDLLKVVPVEPELQAVDVVLGAGLAVTAFWTVR